ncbi:MAG: hypothetical protein U1E53_32970 [Dongiaceae bacterium]
MDTPSSIDFRQRAARCRAMAEAAADPQVRHSFAQLAESYDDLARRDEFARECRRAPDPAPAPR